MLFMLSLYRIRILRILRKLWILTNLKILNFLTYILIAIYETTNPHNRFFFYRLCGFTLSPNNLITSLPRTSFTLSSALLFRVRGSPISLYPTFKLSCENLFCFAYWFCARRYPPSSSMSISRGVPDDACVMGC